MQSTTAKTSRAPEPSTEGDSALRERLSFGANSSLGGDSSFGERLERHARIVARIIHERFADDIGPARADWIFIRYLAGLLASRRWNSVEEFAAAISDVAGAILSHSAVEAAAEAARLDRPSLFLRAVALAEFLGRQDGAKLKDGATPEGCATHDDKTAGEGDAAHAGAAREDGAVIQSADSLRHGGALREFACLQLAAFKRSPAIRKGSLSKNRAAAREAAAAKKRAALEAAALSGQAAAPPQKTQPTNAPHAALVGAAHAAPTKAPHAEEARSAVSKHEGRQPGSGNDATPPASSAHHGTKPQSNTQPTNAPHAALVGAAHAAPTEAPHAAPTNAPHAAPTEAPHAEEARSAVSKHEGRQPGSGNDATPPASSALHGTKPQSTKQPTSAAHAAPTEAPHAEEALSAVSKHEGRQPSLAAPSEAAKGLADRRGPRRDGAVPSLAAVKRKNPATKSNARAGSKARGASEDLRALAAPREKFRTGDCE